jgi:NADH:ubiquinone oxidoreductase subunit 6 (subunit J)
MLIFETAGVTILTAMVAATAVAMPSLPPKKVPS